MAKEETAVAENLNATPPAKGDDSDNPFDWQEPSGDGAPETPVLVAEESDKEAETPSPDNAVPAKVVSTVDFADAEDESDAEEEPETRDEKTQEAEATFPENLLDRAAELGIVEEDATSFDSPEALEAFLKPIEDKMSVAKPPAAAVPKTAKAPEPEVAQEFKLPSLDESTAEPEVLKYIKSMAGEITRLKTQIASNQEASETRAESDQRQFFDQWVSKLGDEWKDTFGEGPTHLLSKRTRARQDREKLYEHAKGLVKLYADQGGPQPDREELWEQSKGALFRSKQDTVAREKIAGKVRNRRGQLTARPTSRRSPTERTEPGSEKKALATARKFMKDHGMTESDQDDTEDMKAFLD